MTSARVLIVDDDPALLQALPETLRLRAGGLAVDTCDSAAAALDRIATTDYDAIISDIKMPGMDGLALLAEVRALRPDTPTLLITGHGEHSLAVQALRGGAYDFIQKPIDREYFVASLNRAIRTRQLSRRVKELDRLAFLGQLAGGISHELRNPLGVIKNSVYYLKIVLPAEDKVGRHLDILEREVDRASRIVTDLLDFARTGPPARARADLSALVRDCLERLPLADGITVTLKLAEDLPKLLVDHDQLGSVLSNLITNAAQAMPEGGVLTIETAADGDGLWVAVADTGVGIAPEHLEKIFEPLFTTKAKGIGLGLAVAKMLVEANGGAVTVESAPGRGTRFEVRFPVAPETS